MAGAAGLEPVTSAVTGQRSNQLSYAPAFGAAERKDTPSPRQAEVEKFGQQTPRRWGWGTPLKKRTATRITPILLTGRILSIGYPANTGKAEGGSQRSEVRRQKAEGRKVES